MADAETEFGQRLRASLDGAAKAAARAVVDERFEKFGGDVVGWAERAARDSVLAAMQEVAQPVYAALGRLEGQIRLAEDGLAKQAELLAAVDAARLRNDYDELEIAKGRLEKSRSDVMAEVRAASSAVAKAAEEARTLVGSVLTARDDCASLASVLAARIEAIHGDVAKTAETAAAAAVDHLKGGILAEMDAFSDDVRGMLTDLAKFRTESAGVLSFARAAMADSLDAIRKRHGDDAGLLLARFRGPHEAGEAYAKGDIATFRGATWIAKRAPGDTLPSADPKGPWALFASGGIGKG
jgi:hypothetical protein